jgi:polysaccharide pyruvyl transferase WcaK-like protein
LLRIHIIHVGSVTNKGTLALVRVQVAELNRICSNPDISVSTCDPEILRFTMPEVTSVSLLIDIPHEKADVEARKRGIDRDSFKYVLSLMAYSIRMIPETIFSLFSAFLFSLGLRRLYKSSVLTQISNSNLVISTADENFKEGSSNLPFNVYWRFVSWTTLFSRTLEILITKRIFKKTIMIFPNSIGPFRTVFGRIPAKLAVRNVDLIFLRESHSITWMRELGPSTPVTVTSDMALLSSMIEPLGQRRVEAQTVTVCPGIYAATLSQEKQIGYIYSHARALDTFSEKHGVKIVFLPLEITGRKNDDYAFCESIRKRMKNSTATTIVKTRTLEEFGMQVLQADLMLSSRMHPAVIAFSCKIPTVVVYYDFKQLGLMEQLDLSMYALDINQISHERLLSVMESAWKNKSKIQEQLYQGVPILQNDIRNKIESSCRKFLDR